VAAGVVVGDVTDNMLRPSL